MLNLTSGLIEIGLGERGEMGLELLGEALACEKVEFKITDQMKHLSLSLTLYHLMN